MTGLPIAVRTDVSFADADAGAHRRPRHTARVADVWICANPNGHLQATGRDARGRKQYRYHPVWVAERDANKFDALEGFALTLPRIRRRVVQDLCRPAAHEETRAGGGGSADRIGRSSAWAANATGATTDRSARPPCAIVTSRSSARKSSSTFAASPASAIGSKSRPAAWHRSFAAASNIRGSFFVYREGDEVKSISAADVNEYLAEASGRAVTSKDFRTWGGTVRAAEYLSGFLASMRGSPSRNTYATQSAARPAFSATRPPYLARATSIPPSSSATRRGSARSQSPFQDCAPESGPR